MLLKLLVTISLVFTPVFSKQALNFKFFENQDKNRDGLLTKPQFLDGLKESMAKSVILT